MTTLPNASSLFLSFSLAYSIPLLPYTYYAIQLGLYLICGLACAQVYHTQLCSFVLACTKSMAHILAWCVVLWVSQK